MMDHGYEQGWQKYTFDNVGLFEERLHGSDTHMAMRRAIHRGVGKPLICFSVIRSSATDDSETIGMHVHRDLGAGIDVEEWYIIIDGEGVMTFSNGDTVNVGPGDFITTYPGTGHSFRSRGDAPLRFVSVVPHGFNPWIPVDGYPERFQPRIQVAEVDPVYMNPRSAVCSDCMQVWRRPADDDGSTTLASWAREHPCTGHLKA